MDNQPSQNQRTLREMERRSQDTIRVYNPTEQDFNVRWNSLLFPVPNKNRDIGFGLGQALHPRYVAMQYFKTMSQKILGEELLDKIREENKVRVERGQGNMKHYEEREAFESAITTTWDDKTAELLPILILGLEQEYGMEPVQEQGRNSDNRSIFEKLSDQFDRPASKPQASTSFPQENNTQTSVIGNTNSAVNSTPVVEQLTVAEGNELV